MNDLDDETLRSSDDEVDPLAHKKLLNAVSLIGKTQYIKKPSRSEPALAQDEFHLVKGVSKTASKASDTAVSVSDLVKVLNKTSKHLDVGKELKNIRRSKRVLPKPLEKPVAEKIQRKIGYDNLKKQLSKWDAVVTRNRVAEQQVFPLEYEEIKVDLRETKKPPEIRIKSDLRKRFEEIEAEYKPKYEEEVSEKNEGKQLIEKLTKEELIARRKKMAYLRIKESQLSAKARLRNRIKSKVYHKLLKKQKLKEQMQEFEKLQKINPKAALVMLEKLERTRVLERANLRHKNTGTWAKNLQVRAKYDKDVQKDLAEQLALSRELTAKLKQESDEESGAELEENEAEGEEDVDPLNPWMKGKKKNEVAEFVSGYRKYWMERNKKETEMEEYKANGEEKENADSRQEDEKFDESQEHKDYNEVLQTREADVFSPENQNQVVKIQENGKLKKPKQKKVKKQSPQKGKKDKQKSSAGDWLVEESIATKKELAAKDIDDIFDEAEDIVQEKVSKKLQEINQSLETKNNRKNFKSFQEKNDVDHLDLSFKKQASRPEFDEELLETPAKDKEDTDNADVLAQVQKAASSRTEEKSSDKNSQVIDPNNFITVKAKTFKTELADIINSGDFMDEGNDDDNEVDRQLSLAAAFEDEDIEADFEKEREEERNKNSTEEVDLTMPGWGSWAGCGVRVKKRSRLVLKFPKEEKRRDENKQKVYINEIENKKLKTHLVSDLPFPFTSVKDYEASIRAPIGADFVPETAFRMLTRPAVVTKMGQIIEPMQKNELVKPPKRPRTVVDRRIADLNKTKSNMKIKK